MSSINPTSVRAIAKKDFQDAVRSWVFWGLSFLFLFLLVGITGTLSYFGEDIAAEGATTDMLIFYTSEITRVIIPLIALVLGWKAVAGERESGSIKVLLSLPHSRKDVIIGKLVGRSAVLSVSLIIGFVLASVVVAGLLGGFDVLDYAGLLVMSIIYGVAYTSIAVSISSLTKSTTLAGGAMFGVFLLFYGAWNFILGIATVLSQRGTLFFDTVTYTREFNGDQMEIARPQDWVYFVVNLDPGEAYNRTLSLITDVELIEAQVELDAAMFGGEVPFFLQDWFSFLILLVWVCLPVAVALYRFDRVDL